jgi:hypothetical protein
MTYPPDSASVSMGSRNFSRTAVFVGLAVKPVGKPDALIGHVRFDERGWETGRRLGVSARAHPRLYTSFRRELFGAQ